MNTQSLKILNLPSPALKKDKAFMQAIKERNSSWYYFHENQHSKRKGWYRKNYYCY